MLDGNDRENLVKGSLVMSQASYRLRQGWQDRRHWDAAEAIGPEEESGNRLSREASASTLTHTSTYLSSAVLICDRSSITCYLPARQFH